jgi:hypothetical protein
MGKPNIETIKVPATEKIDRRKKWQTIQEASEQTGIPQSTFYANLASGRFISTYDTSSGRYYVRKIKGFVADIKGRHKQAEKRRAKAEKKRKESERKQKERNAIKKKVEQLLQEGEMSCMQIANHLGIYPKQVYRIKNK